MIQIPSLRQETRYGIPMADQILFNRQHIIGYSYLLRQPRWALECIDLSNQIVDFEGRKNKFRDDLRVPEQFRSTLQDYKGSGYDRGHLVASANKSASDVLNSETFLLTNMSPQHPRLNQDSWRILEDKVRDLCGKDKIVEVYVICGPLFKIGEKITIIGAKKNKGKKNEIDVVVPVPHAYFKSILAEDLSGKMKMYSFVMPNGETRQPLSTYQKTTSEIEVWAGLALWDKLTGSNYERMKKQKPKLRFSCLDQYQK